MPSASLNIISAAETSSGGGDSPFGMWAKTMVVGERVGVMVLINSARSMPPGAAFCVVDDMFSYRKLIENFFYVDIIDSAGKLYIKNDMTQFPRWVGLKFNVCQNDWMALHA